MKNLLIFSIIFLLFTNFIYHAAAQHPVEVVTGNLLDNISSQQDNNDELKEYQLEMQRQRRRAAVAEQLRQETANRIERETTARAVDMMNKVNAIPFPNIQEIRAANPDASSYTINQIIREQTDQRDQKIDAIRHTSAREIAFRIKQNSYPGILTPVDSTMTKIKNFIDQAALIVPKVTIDIFGDNNSDFGKSIKQAQDDLKTAHEIDVFRRYKEVEAGTSDNVQHFYNYITYTTAGELGKFAGILLLLITIFITIAYLLRELLNKKSNIDESKST